MHIMLSYSHYERRLILDRLSRGAHGAASNGRWPSSSRAAPFGYRKVGIRRDSHLELHRQEAETIREAARLLVDERIELPEVARGALLSELVVNWLREVISTDNEIDP
jgi:DNA invertase Pin-like site-specific DNA recombinase